MHSREVARSVFFHLWTTMGGWFVDKLWPTGVTSTSLTQLLWGPFKSQTCNTRYKPISSTPQLWGIRACICMLFLISTHYISRPLLQHILSYWPLAVPNLIYCYLVLQHQEQSGLLPWRTRPSGAGERSLKAVSFAKGHCPCSAPLISSCHASTLVQMHFLP